MNETLVLFKQPGGSINIQSQTLGALLSHQLRIKTVYTGARHAEDLSFLQLDHPEHQRFPQSWGCGTIIECGSSVKGWHTGDSVLAPLHHQTVQDIDADSVYPIRNLNHEFSIFLNSAMIALHTVHQANINYGDRIAIVGLGVVGLMTLQYALVSGATHITAIDPLPERCHTAQRLGAHQIGSPDQFNQISHQYDIVIECSGNDHALRQAELLTANSGTLTLCGKQYSPDQLNQVNGSSKNRNIVLKQSMNAKTSEMENRVIRSLQKKHAIVWPIPYHIVPFQQAPDAYAELRQKPNQWIQLGLSYDS